MSVSIEPRLFSHGDRVHFRAFTDIEKKAIFAHTVNFYQYFQKVDLYSEAFSICIGLSRVSQGFGHHIDVRNLHEILVRTVIFLPIRLARMAL